MSFAPPTPSKITLLYIYLVQFYISIAKSLSVLVCWGTATEIEPMRRPCQALGCTAMAASGFSHYCRNHRARLRRHGAVDQTGITATDPRPYVERVRQRIRRTQRAPCGDSLTPDGWPLLTTRVASSGKPPGDEPDPSTNGRRAREVLKLIAETEPRSVVEVALAMFLIWDQEPRRFRTDEGFRFQLVDTGSCAR